MGNLNQPHPNMGGFPRVYGIRGSERKPMENTNTGTAAATPYPTKQLSHNLVQVVTSETRSLIANGPTEQVLFSVEYQEDSQVWALFDWRADAKEPRPAHRSNLYLSLTAAVAAAMREFDATGVTR